jgi:hypothetical protein
MAKFKDFKDITPQEQLVRWENCLRVLEEMTPHQRKKHFDMSNWGFVNECGTIACAAGSCGLDPWFIRRGFKLIPHVLTEEEKEEEKKIQESPTDVFRPNFGWAEEALGTFKGFEKDHRDAVYGFFGHEGAQDIFFNDTVRTVKVVIKEVKAYIALMIATRASINAQDEQQEAADKYYETVTQ